MAEIGDRIFANWTAELDWFYPGVVCGLAGDLVEIQFDDGDRGMVPVVETRPLRIEVGMEIFGNWRGAGAYYPGKIARITGDALFIDYNDGDHEVTSVSALRIHRVVLG